MCYFYHIIEIYEKLDIDIVLLNPLFQYSSKRFQSSTTKFCTEEQGEKNVDP